MRVDANDVTVFVEVEQLQAFTDLGLRRQLERAVEMLDELVVRLDVRNAFRHLVVDNLHDDYNNNK